MDLEQLVSGPGSKPSLDGPFCPSIGPFWRRNGAALSSNVLRFEWKKRANTKSEGRSSRRSPANAFLAAWPGCVVRDGCYLDDKRCNFRRREPLNTIAVRRPVAEPGSRSQIQSTRNEEVSTRAKTRYDCKLNAKQSQVDSVEGKDIDIPSESGKWERRMPSFRWERNSCVVE